MQKPLDGELVPPGVTTPVDEQEAARDEVNVRRNFWTTFKKALRYIPFSNELVAAYHCALDPETPFHVRATLLGALAYFVLPVDMVPDFIVGLGFSDDVTVLAATLFRVRQYITNDHREKANQTLRDVG